MRTSRLAILLSGSGSTAQAVIQASLAGELRGITPVVVISSCPGAVGLEKARVLGIDTRVVEKKNKTMAEFGKNLLQTLTTYASDVVSQNGWLPLTPPYVVTAYEGRIINQHPGPLHPGLVDFGGIGMYGRRVTAARIAYAWMTGENYWTESTVHHVTHEFDKGAVIRIERLPFSPKLRMSLGQLQRHTDELVKATNAISKSLLPLEHKNVIETLRIFSRVGHFPVFKRKKALVSAKNEAIAVKAKELAIRLFPKG